MKNNEMKFIIVGYYTRNTLYEKQAKKFIVSLKRFDIPYYVEGIDNLGDWYKNCNYKPVFIKKMLLKFPKLNIVYVDVDARFLKYPILFETLDCDIAVHNFDRSAYGKHAKGFEILSGTVFLKNNKEVYKLVEEWERKCKEFPHDWEQRSLQKVLHGRFYNLPPEYCTIIDTMSFVKEPVIVHNQVSRRVRKNRGNLQ